MLFNLFIEFKVHLELDGKIQILLDRVEVLSLIM